MTTARPSAPKFGNYELLSLLGKGGMAEVFKARVLSGPRAGWLVALKRPMPEFSKDPDYVDLFASEADLSKFLDHPNIVKTLEVGVIGETYFMVMELVDGRDVGQIVKRCQARGIPWPIDFAVYLVHVLLEALSYAHNAVGPTGRPLNIVHCDISPSNLFVSRTGDIKLGDFGVARARTAQSFEGQVMGKPYYLSPEALEGETSPATDLWAAAVTLYELLTLDRPFKGKKPEDVFEAIRARNMTPLRTKRPDVPAELAAVLDKAMAQDPKARFQTAAEFALALKPHYDERVGTPLAISAIVRGLFGSTDVLRP